MFKLFTAFFMGLTTLLSGVTPHSTATPATNQQIVLSQQEIRAMASDRFADGNLPLGDNKYTTTTAKKGYIYLCHAKSNANGGGAQKTGSWIHGSTWNIKDKIFVTGNVMWKNATFADSLTDGTRTLSGDDVPSHTTGNFPIQSSDPAYQYDRNPNSIKAQSFSDTFPAVPTYSDTPYCMGGEAGIMLTGVALFNGFDAGLRDAAAYEVQDSCQGHPQVSGEYHYHSLSSCITDVSETTVIGFALDGFPITGPKVTDTTYLTTDDLDECHGITSEIMLDGKKTTIYHYVMTEDFPYSVSCFRGKPVSLQVENVQQGKVQNSPVPSTTQGQARMIPLGQPPSVLAKTACVNKTQGASCSFSVANGTITGTCQTPPAQNFLACVPAGAKGGIPQGQGAMPPVGY
ncbi:MAG TPA: YHYH protein [Patescibacteria group bacterium]|nr:YHYH protein [Patescibacteria group bacterium]